MTREIYQKEFSIGKILSESWKMFTENFQLILIITLIVYVPIDIITSIIPAKDFFEFLGVERSIELYFLISQILGKFIGIIAMMAIAFAIKNKIDGKSINIGGAFKKSLSRWGAAIGTSVILTIFVLGLTLLLVVPGIIFSVYWIFTLYAVILRDRSAKNAMDYSKSIVKGRWWTVVGYSIVFGILASIIIMSSSVLDWFLPKIFIVDEFFINITTDTVRRILQSFFTVVMTIFFINFDSTKLPSPKSKGDVPKTSTILV